MKNYPRSRRRVNSMHVLLFTAGLLVSGCDSLVNMDVPVLGSPSSWFGGDGKDGQEASAVRVVNETGETIQIHLMEYQAAQKGYWSWPDNPPVIAPGHSVDIPFSKIWSFESGQHLYVGISAERNYTGVPQFTPVGSLHRAWNALEESTFIITVVDDDILMGEDYYDNK